MSRKLWIILFYCLIFVVSVRERDVEVAENDWKKDECSEGNSIDYDD